MVYLGLPIKNGGSVHGELLNNQMVFIFCRKVPISPEENSSHFSSSSSRRRSSRSRSRSSSSSSRCSSSSSSM